MDQHLQPPYHPVWDPREHFPERGRNAGVPPSQMSGTSTLLLLLAQPRDPLFPPLPVDFRDSLGFVGAGEPVCPDGSPGRPPGSPGNRVLQ